MFKKRAGEEQMNEIRKEIKKLQEKIKELEKEEKEVIESNVFKIATNTAYLLNIGLDEKFRGYGFFPDWLRTKHEQHWIGKNDSTIEITFKLKLKKEQELK